LENLTAMRASASMHLGIILAGRGKSNRAETKPKTKKTVVSWNQRRIAIYLMEML